MKKTECSKAIRNPEVKARLEKMNFSVDYKPPAEMTRLIAEEYGTVSGIAKKIGLGR